MNVSDTIEALGGISAVAESLGVGLPAVRNWRRLNAFPPRLYLTISGIAKQQDIEVDSALFRELSVDERP